MNREVGYVPLLILFGAVAAATIGCGAPQPGWGAQSVGWGASNAGTSEVPGITTASVSFCRYGEKCAAAFWLDGHGGSLGAHRENDRNAVHFEGQGVGRDGRTIALECMTADGTTGNARIDGQSFDLSKGALFLISTADGATAVKQLRRDLSALKPDTNALQSTAANDAEVRSFFEMHAQVDGQ
jgi:hypothetical protein